MRAWAPTALVIGMLATASCSFTEPRGDALPSLAVDGAPESTTSTIAEPIDALDRWYARHRDTVRVQLDEIALLIHELAGSGDATVVDRCKTVDQVADRSYDRARRAIGAHPDWVRTVDLTTWMVVACSGGDAGAVREILPELEAALDAFTAWLAGRSSDLS